MQVGFEPSGVCFEVPAIVADWANAAASDMMDADELLHLAAALAAFDWTRDAIVVEIGAYTGRTTVFMARTLSSLGARVPVLSVDAFERTQPDALNPRGSYAAYMASVQAAGVEDVCLPLAAFSSHALPVVPANIGVLVVDGGHEYSVVRDDLAGYAPKVLPGGFLFADDYSTAYPGVVRAIDGFLETSAFRLLHRTHFVVAQRLA